MKANDVQPGGDHYKNKQIQPWDYIAANNIGFFEGSVISYKRGDKSHLAKLTTAEVVEIRSMKLNGLKTKELSERFNISRDNIRRIIRRDTWRYI